MKSTTICMNTELPIDVADDRFQAWPFNGRTCECGDHDPMPISDDFGSEDAAPAITTVPQLVDAFCILADHVAQQPALTPDVRGTIHEALVREHLAFLPLSEDVRAATFAVKKLWAIDRARRALGLED